MSAPALFPATRNMVRARRWAAALASGAASEEWLAMGLQALRNTRMLQGFPEHVADADAAALGAVVRREVAALRMRDRGAAG